jgi:adenylate kinase family enzyme
MKETSWKNAYAYTFGINQYKSLSTLSFCENDAKLFEESIKNIIPNIKTSLIIGNELTNSKFHSIINNIRHMGIDKTENNVLFFYYAGHGFFKNGIDYLTCFDTDASDDKRIEITSIPTTELIEASYLSGIKTVIMIFDACRSIITRSTLSSMGTLSFGKSTSEISRRQGIISFFSCSPGEYSQELGYLSHGIFTYALVEAFNECQFRAPIYLDKIIGEKVANLVQKNNLPEQKPFTTVGPIEKSNLDIVTGQEITIRKIKPKCILIAGSTHAGKSNIGEYLAQKYSFGHYEMSSLAYSRYNEFRKNNQFDGTIQDFLEKELWSKNEDKDIIARDLLENYKGNTNIIISGPRLIEEIDTLLNYDWDVIPLYIYSEPQIRLKRYKSLQKDNSFFNEFSFEEFIRRDMRELHWGLAKMATLEKFRIIINNESIEQLYNVTKHYTDPFINENH